MSLIGTLVRVESHRERGSDDEPYACSDGSPEFGWPSVG